MSTGKEKNDGEIDVEHIHKSLLIGDAKKIPDSELKLEDVIGRGGFGNVFRAVWKNQTAVAVKVFDDVESTQDFCNEVELLLNLQHSTIIEFYGIAFLPFSMSGQKSMKSCFVTELMDDGSLDHVLHQNLALTISKDDIYSWAIQIANGIAFFHSRNIVHRDIKPQNILLKNCRQTLKIADFGLSRKMANKSTAKTAICRGTLEYIAPEVFLRHEYKKASDIYSYGITLWEMFARKKPYSDVHKYQIMIGVSNGSLRPPIDDTTIADKQMRSLIVSCWHGDSSQRPIITNIIPVLLQCRLSEAPGIAESVETSKVSSEQPSQLSDAAMTYANECAAQNDEPIQPTNETSTQPYLLSVLERAKIFDKQMHKPTIPEKPKNMRRKASAEAHRWRKTIPNDKSDMETFGCNERMIGKEAELVERTIKCLSLRDEQSIPSSDLKVCDTHLLGRSIYGAVWKAEWNKQLVAIKVCEKNDMVKTFFEEAELLRYLQHQNIIKLHGIAYLPMSIMGQQQTLTPCIVTELMEDGSLSDVLHQNLALSLSTDDICNWALQIANGIAFFHSHNIVHRNINPEIILLTNGRRTIKIADFGMERKTVSNDTDAVCGNLPYIAPEVLIGHEYTKASDIYSYGITLWEMFARKKPYSDVHKYQIMIGVSNGSLRPPIDDTTIADKQMRSLIVRCINGDHLQRITMSNIITEMQCRQQSEKKQQHTTEPTVLESSFSDLVAVPKSDASLGQPLQTSHSNDGADPSNASDLCFKSGTSMIRRQGKQAIAIVTPLPRTLSDQNLVLQSKEYCPYIQPTVDPKNSSSKVVIAQESSDDDDNVTCHEQIHHSISAEATLDNGRLALKMSESATLIRHVDNIKILRPVLHEAIEVNGVHSVKIGDMSDNGVQKSEHGNDEDKVMLLVGGTGSGKTTLLNVIINYCYDVSWDDKFRFEIVSIDDEMERAGNINIAASKTKTVTAYTLHNSILPYRLTIVDTPGFGDTDGIERDKKTCQQIQDWLQIQSDTGLGKLHAICLVIKANENRLQPHFKYEVDQVMSLFDRQFEGNIFPFFTFADESKPLALAALSESKIRHGQYFLFNNGCLFTSGEMSRLIWQSTCASYNQYFMRHLPGVQCKSVRESVTLIDARRRLEHKINDRQQKMKLKVQHVDDISREFQFLVNLEQFLEQNKSDLYYTTYEYVIIKQPLPQHKQALVCTACITSCHVMCTQSTSSIRRCRAFNWYSGQCNVCPQQCPTNVHRLENFAYHVERQAKKHSRPDIVEKYADAKQKAAFQMQKLKKLAKEASTIDSEIVKDMCEIHDCLQEIKKLALYQSQASTNCEFINTLIRAEEREMREGYTERVEYLRHQISIAKEIETLANGDVNNSTVEQLQSHSRENWRELIIKRFPMHADWLRKFDQNA